MATIDDYENYLLEKSNYFLQTEHESETESNGKSNDPDYGIINEDLDNYMDVNEILATYVRITAEQIFNGYLNKITTYDPKSMLYITDKDILSAINRKTLEIHNLLITSYNITIAKELINQTIRRQLKYLAYNK